MPYLRNVPPSPFVRRIHAFLGLRTQRRAGTISIPSTEWPDILPFADLGPNEGDADLAAAVIDQLSAKQCDLVLKRLDPRIFS